MSEPEIQTWYLTPAEEASVREALRSDWVQAAVLADRYTRGREGLAVTIVSELAGWTEKQRIARVQRDNVHAALGPHRRQWSKVTLIGHGLLAVAGVLLWFALETAPFVDAGFPALMALAVLWSGVRATGCTGAAWLALAFPSFLLAGGIIVASQDNEGHMSTAGMPLAFLMLLGFTVGLAQLKFGALSQYGAAAPDLVRRARLAWRITAINVALQGFVVQLALYWLVVRGDVLDETVFNALFRYVLFAPALAIVLAISLGLIANHLRKSIIAILAPPAWCLVHILESGQGIYSFILQWAMIDILTAVLIVPVIAWLSTVPGERVVPLLITAVATTLLGLLAFGIVKLGLEELFAIGSLIDRWDLLLWIIVPAVVSVLDETIGVKRQASEVRERVGSSD